MAVVEEFDVAGDAAPPVGGDRSGSRGRWTRRAVPWVAAAAVLVVVGAVTASPTELIAGRGSGPDVGLVEMDLAQPPTVLWQAELPTDVVAFVAGDRALLTRQQLGIGRTIIGIDLANGTQVWEYDDDGYSCQWGSPMVCVSSVGAPEATLDVVDLDDGSRISTPYPGAIAAIAVGARTAVVVKTQSAWERVVLLDGDGTQLWQVDVDASYTAIQPMWTFAHITGEELWFQTTTSVRIDLATGRLVEGDSPFSVLADGTAVDVAGGLITVRTREGDAVLEVDETAIWTDDDVGGPVQLHSDLEAEVTAVVRDSGRELWQFGEAPCYPEARLLGVVVMSCWSATGSRIHGVEEVTGETIWTYDEQFWLAAASADTLVFRSDTDERLLAIDPSTGATRWELPVPVGETERLDTAPISNGLLVSTSETVLRLLWPMRAES
jgi:outer membrane protein assembly factor BamB